MKNNFPRILPTPDELERLFLLGHTSEPRHKGNDFLIESCKTCRHIPRSPFLTLWWVQANRLWNDLIYSLPPTLQESFQSRREEAPKNASGKKATEFALAWCLREADHLEALKRESFVGRMEYWNDKIHIGKWEFLDLTYLPPYDIAFVMKVAKAAHSSSRKRTHASAYWSRGGITRYDGAPASQGFWTACAGPLAVRMRPHVEGKRNWDKGKDRGEDRDKEKTPVPRALWRQIIELWQLRYPDRELPSPEALRRRVTSSFAL